MTCIHYKEVNKIAEYNLLHDILIPPKRPKNRNSHNYPIIHGCMNTKRIRTKFKNFQILVDSGCSSTIVIGRLVKNNT